MTREASGHQPTDSAPKTVSANRPDTSVLEVTVVLLNDGIPSTAISPIEVFESAGVLWNRLHGETVQPRFRVRSASTDGKAVRTTSSVGLTPEYAIDDIESTDVIIIPACGLDLSAQLASHASLLPWLRDWHARGAYVAGVCSGVGFLAECGLLNDRRATTHWGIAEAMKQRYPRADWQTEQFVTEDDRVLCCGGVYASIDLSLYLVQKFCGHDVALKCARSLLVNMPRSRQSGYAAVTLPRPHADAAIRQCEEYLQHNFTEELSIELLATRSGIGSRHFIRRFKAATGRLPGAYIQTLRVTAARELLERSEGSIQDICTKVGYRDIGFFRRLFKRHTSMTPAEYRKRFARMSFDRGELAASPNVRGPEAG